MERTINGIVDASFYIIGATLLVAGAGFAWGFPAAMLVAGGCNMLLWIKNVWLGK